MTWVTVVENDNFSMKYSTKLRTLYHTFHKPIVAQEFRDFLELGLTTFTEQGLVQWLSDDRQNNDLPTDDLEWTQDWSERAIAAGLKYWAIVVPDDVVTRGEMLPLVKLYSARGVKVSIFSKVDYAMQWIKNN